MTDPTPTPTAADAPWLAVALRDIAETAPVGPPPPLTDAELRVDDGRGAGPRRVLAAAAAVVVLAAGAVLVVRSDGGSREQVPGSVRTSAPTGWYVPEGLPDGWEVRDVSILPPVTRACPCRDLIWADPFSAAWVGYSSEPADGPLEIADPGGVRLAGGAVGVIASDSSVDVDLGGGITGQLVTGGSDAFQIQWMEGDRTRSVASRIVPRQRLEAWARELVGHGDPTDGPEADWDQTHDATYDGAFDTPTLVNVELGTPDGNVVRYLLLANGEAGRFEAGLERVPRTIEGQTLPFTQLQATPGQQLEVRPLTGRWPGSDLVIDLAEGQPVPTQAEVDALAASLRPATAEQWRRFVTDAGNDDPRFTESSTVDALDATD